MRRILKNTLGFIIRANVTELKRENSFISFNNNVFVNHINRISLVSKYNINAILMQYKSI